MQSITVIIDQDGKIELKTKGYKGRGCMAASKFLEEALGNTLEIKKTGEFYSEEQPEKVRVNRGNGN